MATQKSSKFFAVGANALLGFACFGIAALASERPPGDQPANAPATTTSAAPAASTTVTHAAPAAPQSIPRFEALDRNHDGILARDEVPADLDLSRTYANYDLNGDGKLTRDEFAKYKQWKDELARMQGAAKRR